MAHPRADAMLGCQTAAIMGRRAVDVARGEVVMKGGCWGARRRGAGRGLRWWMLPAAAGRASRGRDVSQGRVRLRLPSAQHSRERGGSGVGALTVRERDGAEKGVLVADAVALPRLDSSLDGSQPRRRPARSGAAWRVFQKAGLGVGLGVPSWPGAAWRPAQQRPAGACTSEPRPTSSQVIRSGTNA